jgi:signal peptidase complex subunit 2
MSESDVQIIETGDSIKVKQVLDECVMEAVQTEGFTINYKTENLKMLLMFLCCVFACVAQFYPSKFPENSMLLGGCVGRYHHSKYYRNENVNLQQIE